MTKDSRCIERDQCPIDISKVPFKLDAALVKRATLEEDVVAIAAALWRLLAKDCQISGWERAGVQRSVTRLGNQ